MVSLWGVVGKFGAQAPSRSSSPLCHSSVCVCVCLFFVVFFFFFFLGGGGGGEGSMSRLVTSCLGFHQVLCMVTCSGGSRVWKGGFHAHVHSSNHTPL